MKIKSLQPIWIGLFSMLLVFQASAHSCKGLKSAHCACNVTVGVNGDLLGQVTNHGACYNQQANMGPASNCAQYCSTQSSQLESAAKAGLKARKLCGSRNVAFKYSAGTNVFSPYWITNLLGCFPGDAK